MAAIPLGAGAPLRVFAPLVTALMMATPPAFIANLAGLALLKV
jgi:predicted benzoate:H+ symporter BenE